MRMLIFFAAALILMGCAKHLDKDEIRRQEQACLNAGGYVVTESNGLTEQVYTIDCKLGDK
jgi:hypothetical protein